MPKLNRIENTRKLIRDLRDLDVESLKTLDKYNVFMHELREYADGGTYADEVLIAIGNLIEEAMERE